MATSKYPNDSKCEASSAAAQLVYDNIQNKIMADLLTAPDIRQLEASIDPVEFLQTLRLSHGITPSDHGIAKDEHGSPVFIVKTLVKNPDLTEAQKNSGPLYVVGTVKYRPVEFLKHRMHFTAEQSGRIIRGEQTSMDLVGPVSSYELKLRASKWEIESWYVAVDSPKEAHALMRFLNAVEKDHGEDFNIVFTRVIKVPYPLEIGTRARNRGRVRSYAIIQAPIEAMRKIIHYGYPASLYGGVIVRGREIHSENMSHNGDWKWASFTFDIIEDWMGWAAKNLTPHPNGKYWASWADKHDKG